MNISDLAWKLIQENMAAILEALRLHKKQIKELEDRVAQLEAEVKIV